MRKLLRARWFKFLAPLNRTSIAATLFLAAFFSYAYFYQGGGQNEAARLDSVRSFIDQHRLEIDTYAYNSADVIQVNGHIYSGKAPGTFYMALIPFAVTEGVLRVLGVEEESVYHWSCYTATVWSISLVGALTLVLLYWFCLRLGTTREEGAIVALTIGFGTIFFPFATLFFSHVAAAFCLFLAFYQLLAYKQRELDNLDDREHWRPLLTGLALGFSITLEYPSAIACVLIGLYALWVFRTRDFWKASLAFTIGVFLGVLPLFVYNWYAFHNPFYITYEAYSQSTNKVFEAHKKGVLGIRFPLFDWSAWPQFWSNLQEITFKPLRGIFFATPVVLFAPIGFAIQAYRAIRRRYTPAGAEILVGAAMFAAYICFNASFGDSITYWGGGASFGPRYLIVALPFMAPAFITCWRSRWLKPAFVVLALYSVFTCLMATAIEPRTGYGPPNPIFFFYLPRYLTATFAINNIGIFTNSLLTMNSVAFNWGKLFELPRQFELVPLFALWLIVTWKLDTQLMTVDGEVDPRFTRVVAVLVAIAAWIPIGSLIQ